MANNEYLKTDGAEEEYQKIFASDDWKNRYLKITIDGEEIDLEDWDNSCPEYWEVKRELIKKIKSEIKQNPSEWKIEKGKNENYCDESNNRLIKHVSGQRHWKCAISYYMSGNSSERLKHWTEIESLINGTTIPKFNNKENKNQISNTEKEKIRQYFLKNNIKEIKFENGELIITHNNNNNNNETKAHKEIFHNPELLKLMEYCQNSQGNKITKESLGLSSNNTSTNPETNKGNHKLVIGLALGAGAVILVGAIVYFIKKRNKNK